MPEIPPGVTSCTITYGKALGFRTDVQAQAAVDLTLTADRSLTHVATGWTFHSAAEKITVGPGRELSFTVPHVDQDGFNDSSGHPITMWSYRVTGTIRFIGGATQTIDKTLQPLVGTDTLDLADIPDGPPTPPVSSPSLELQEARDARDDAAASAQVAETAAAGAITSSAKTAVRSAFIGSKILGGNITVKPGYGWLQLHSEWDWDHWIKPQVDRAVALGLNAVRLIGAPHAPLVAPTFAAWGTSQDYSTSSPDIIRQNAGKLYRLVTPGVTASTGSGPTGTGTGITDGTAVWDFVRTALTAIDQATYDAHWVQLADYCTQKGLALYPALCDIGAFDAVSVGDYTNASVVASIVSTAAALSSYKSVIGFDVFQEADTIAGYAVERSRGYGVGARVYNTAGQGYIATTGGTSAATGGPTGTGSSITDGTVVWKYDHEVLMVADVLSVYASIRSVSPVPLTTSTAVSNGFAFDDRDAWSTLLHTAAGGSDFIDLHLYASAVTPRDLDYLAFRTGKPFVVGEFGADQSLASDTQLARFTAVEPIHERDGVRGSFAWALADQGKNSPARLAGIWDNTGFVEGASPLSTTSGKRAALVAAFMNFGRSPAPRQYEPENLLSPERARPVRAMSTLPGSSVAYWGAGANTAKVADPRGLGFKCVAGGSTSRAIVGAGSVEPVPVTPLLAYELSVNLMAQGTGRSGILVFVDWIAADKTTLVATSAVASGSDAPDTPSTATLVVVAPSGAAYAQPTVQWPASQATDEVHIIRSAWFGLG